MPTRRVTPTWFSALRRVAGWTAIAGDWNSDGLDTIGLYAPGTGNFYLKNANTPGNADLVFGYGPGGRGWKPVTGNWGVAGGGSTTSIQWLVTDQLGTPRLVFDKTGALATTKRHDYLPFGEELFAGTGGRTGPFVVADPQNWNRYAYTINNPLKFTDPTGRSLSLNGEAADDFVDYLQRRSGLSLVRDAKTGRVTIAKGSKRNENGTSKEFAKLLKSVIGDDSAKVGYTVKNDAGSGILFDDGDAAEKSHGQSGVIDFGDVKNADAQASELATTAVAHVLYEGLRLATKQSNGSDTPFTGDIGFGLSDARAGAPCQRSCVRSENNVWVYW